MRSLLGRFHRPNARSQRQQLFMLNNLGDGSTLSLDFTTGSLPGGLTFKRSTTATYINSSGYVASAAIDNPRFDYTSGILRGLLIEGGATNLLNWSESFATSGGTNNNWADTSITRTTGQADPANGTTAIRFAASAGNATVISSAAIGTSAQRTFSVWLRRVTGTGNIQYTTDNGTTWITQAITSAWVRYTFAATTAAQQVGIQIVTSGNAIEMWGAQLEDYSGASSYIPTVASQGTRGQDALTSASSAAASRTVEFSLDDLTSGTSSLSALTLLLEYQRGGMSNDFPAVLYTRNDANSAKLDFRDYSSTTVETKTASRSVQSKAGIGATAIVKAAIAADGVNQPSSAINGTATTPGSGTIDSMVGNKWTQLGGIAGAVTGKYNSISLRRLKIWPTVLPNTTLQSLTT